MDVETLAETYVQNRSVEINRQLVTALLAEQQYAEALNYANDLPEAYVASDFQLIYLDLLLHEAEFILAREFINLLDNSKGLIERIEQAEMSYRVDFPESIKKISRDFYHLSEYPLNEQADRLKHALRLPLADFLVGAKFVLIDPFGSQVTRTNILDHLRRVELAEMVTSLWFDQTEHQFKPVELPDLFEQPVRLAVQKEISLLNDPVMERSLEQINQYIMINLYPFAAEVILDVPKWVQGLLDNLLGDDDQFDLKSQADIRQAILGTLDNLA